MRDGASACPAASDSLEAVLGRLATFLCSAYVSDRFMTQRVRPVADILATNSQIKSFVTVR